MWKRGGVTAAYVFLSEEVNRMLLRALSVLHVWWRGRLWQEGAAAAVERQIVSGRGGSGNAQQQFPEGGRH